MRIALLCATQRGILFLRKLRQLIPDAKITIFSFQETPWEPPYFDDMRALAGELGLDFFETKSFKDQVTTSFWESADVDIMFAVNWRYLIPRNIYQRPRLGTYVFHDSLLPEYRGFSPTVWAIINGEDHAGVSLFAASDEWDTGDIVDQVSIPIGGDEVISDVMEHVNQAYLELLERNLRHLLAGRSALKPQDHSRATYTCKRIPADNLIDWRWPARRIYNLIRAVSRPYPGAYTYLEGQKIFIWKALLADEDRDYVGAIPGRVSRIIPQKGTIVHCGQGCLLLIQVQKDKGDVMFAPQVINSHSQTLNSVKSEFPFSTSGIEINN